MYRTRHDELRKRIEKDTYVPHESDHNKIIDQLRDKIAFLEAEQAPNDYPKRLSKLQKEY